jgi:hypothetical protein
VAREKGKEVKGMDEGEGRGRVGDWRDGGERGGEGGQGNG